MIINHNIAALNTVRQLNSNSDAAKKSIEKLSSGFRINRAGDDAAGLAISEKMRGQIRGLDQSTRNAQDGISLIQTAEGALSETHSILQRMRELSVQSATGTYTTSDRQNLQNEFDQLTSEVNRIASDTEFNTKKLLNGDLSSTAKTATSANGVVGSSAGVATVIAGQNATAGITSIALNSGGTLTANTAAVWVTGVLSGSLAGNVLSTDLLTNVKMVGSISLGLTVGDNITINAVVGGAVKSSVFTVTSTSTMADLEASIQNTTGGSSATIATASGTGPTLSGANGLDNWGSGFQPAAATAPSGVLVFTGQTGSANDITSFSITAKGADGTVRSTFGTAFNGGLNGGLRQVGVAANNGDLIALVDSNAAGATAGDSTIAVRANAVIKASNLTIGFGTTLNASGTASVTVGSTDGSANIHIGANQSQVTNLSIGANDASTLGLQTNGVNLSIQTSISAESAITTVDAALTSVSSTRSKMGAIQNRLEHTINNLGTSSENLTASESRIRDVDMASEMMQFTKNNILSQAAQAMLAQANQQPQGVLQLLR